MLAGILGHLGITHQWSSCVKERCVQPPEMWGTKWDFCECLRNNVWGTRWRGSWWGKIPEWCSEQLLRGAVGRHLEQEGGQTCMNIWNFWGSWEMFFPPSLLHFYCVMGLKWGTVVELAEFQRIGMLVSKIDIYCMKNFNSNQILHLKAFQLQNFMCWCLQGNLQH